MKPRKPISNPNQTMNAENISERGRLETPSRALSPFTAGRLLIVLALTFLALLIAGPGAQAQSNMVAWWQMWNRSNNFVLDSSGNGHSAQIFNHPAFGFDNDIGLAYVELSSANTNYLQVAAVEDLNFLGDWTASLWVRPVPLSNNTRIFLLNKNMSEEGNDGGYAISVQSGKYAGTDWKVEFTLYDGLRNYALSSDPSLPPGQWSHVALAFDSSTHQARIFVNGAVVPNGKSLLNAANMLENNRPLLIGGEIDEPESVSGSIDGAIADIRLFSRKLSESEMLVVYRSWQTLTGTVEYHGAQSGDIWVALNRTVIASRYETYRERLSLPGDFSFTNVAPGSNYLLWAFMDTNADGLFNYGEPVGSCALNPLSVTNVMINVVITLRDMSSTDADGDGIPDDWEQFFAVPTGLTNHASLDLEGDVLTNFQEYTNYTNPLLQDTDRDGLPDGWEVRNHLNPCQANYELGVQGSIQQLVIGARDTVTNNTVFTAAIGTNLAGSKVLFVASTNGFQSNDLILVIVSQDAVSNASMTSVGQYEFNRVDAVSNGSLILRGPLSNNYIVATTQRIQVVQVPEYISVTVHGTLTCPPWNGQGGGILALVARELSFGSHGKISADGKGFRGGQAVAADGGPYAWGVPGEGTTGYGIERGADPAGRVEGGGGAGHGADGSGGGGGYGGAGEAGLRYQPLSDGGLGGSSFGMAGLDRLYFGGGGGGSGSHTNGAAGVGGGAGGGIVFLRVDFITGLGTVSCNGQSGDNGKLAVDTLIEGAGGGGGAGGSIYVVGRYSSSNIFAANAGRGGQPAEGTRGRFGGRGGPGRIRIDTQIETNVLNVSPIPYTGQTATNWWFGTYQDSDQDGMDDYEEYLCHTDPLAIDTDGDFMPDNWEHIYQLNSTNVPYRLDPTSFLDLTTDQDGDGVPNIIEYFNATRPDLPNTDQDPLYPGVDLFNDFFELFILGTNPGSITNTSNIAARDSDGDGLPDGWEASRGLDPRANDANDDFDQDDLTNLEEYNFGSDPSRIFTGTNTVSDYERLKGKRQTRYYYDETDRLIGVEYQNGQVIVYDYDKNGNIVQQLYVSREGANGFPTWWEYRNGLTNNAPNNQLYGDADGDGWSNYQEWKAGSDPRDQQSQPDVLGPPGTKLASLVWPFVPLNFVLAAGDLDGDGADELVVAADGDPLNDTNPIFILTHDLTLWSTQRVDIGAVGITSIAIGQPANRSVAIYLGLRETNGRGRVVELGCFGGNWQSSLVAESTNQAAYVLGVRAGHDVLVSFAPTNGPTDALYSLSFSNSWQVNPYDTNASRSTTMGAFCAKEGLLTNGAALRLLEGAATIQLASGLSSNSTGLLLAEPPVAHRLNWRGSGLVGGFPRWGQTNAFSLVYIGVDDKNDSGRIDAGDELAVTEYLVVGGSSSESTRFRQSLANSLPAQSYGVATVRYVSTADEIVFTAEPDGRIFAWTATGATNSLQRQLFCAQHLGKTWHALASVKMLPAGQALAGLRVGPTAPRKCDVMLWPPMPELWKPATLRSSAPLARVLPTPDSGGASSKVGVRMWDAEGNPALPWLQFFDATTMSWSNATVVSIDGGSYRYVEAHPTGTVHQLTWNAAGDLGTALTNDYLLRARACDLALAGEWCAPTLYHLAISTATIIAKPDFARTRDGFSVDIAVLDNDVVANQRRKQIRRFDQETTYHGSVTSNANQTLRYSPAAAFSYGTDTFTYQLSDGAGGISTALVSVVVTNSFWIVLASVSPERRFTFSVGGIDGEAYAIQVSEDLMNWTTLDDIILNIDGQADFKDLQATNSWRFYRAVLCDEWFR